MKKMLFAGLLGLSLLFTSENASAQAWTKDSKVLSIGLGGAYFYHFGSYNYYRNILGVPVRYSAYYGSSLTGQFSFQGEFGVHDYVGVGFTTGVGGRAPWSTWYAGEVNFPIGAIANFHFYQLIQDKTGKSLHADKLDIYAGVNIGSGFAAIFFKDGVDNNTAIVPIIFGGPQVGIRYYFTPNVAVNGEVGYGKTWVNAGLSFKL